MTQDQHKLEPCPFCGATANDGEGPVLRVGELGYHFVFCNGCGASGPENAFFQTDAIPAWNRRAHLQQRPLPGREGAERDAERYRWLRNTGFWYTSPNGSPWAVLGTGAGDATPCCGQELDAAIDAGMADMPPLASSPSVQNMGEGETGKDGVDVPLKGQQQEQPK